MEEKLIINQNNVDNLINKTYPHQYYLLDYNPEQYQAIEYYSQRKDIDNNTIPQIIHKCFVDIEVFNEFKDEFPEPKYASKPISAISLMFTQDEGKVGYVLFLKHESHKSLDVKNIEKDILNKIEKDYNYKLDKLNVLIFEEEEKLLEKYFEFLHSYDPAVIAGFNSYIFDFPYIYKRALNLFGKAKCALLISKFPITNFDPLNIELPDFEFVDMRKLYVPPPEGFGFGNTLENYSLNTIAEEELNLRKVEYEEKNLDELYMENPELYIYYNFVDTLLIYMLDKKLDHINLLNMQRRITCSSYSYGLIGRSKLGEDLLTFRYREQNLQPRAFLQKEKISSFTKFNEENFKSFSLSFKYFGAYVRNPGKPKKHSGLIVDFDQSSMYPSIDEMFNISYETYQGILYNYPVFKFLSLLKEIINNQNLELLQNLEKKLHFYVDDFVDNKLKPQSKNDIKKFNKELITYLLYTLFDSGYSFEDILAFKDYYLSKTKLIPLLEIVNFIHPESKEYNEFIYDYLFMDKDDFYNKWKTARFVIHYNPTSSKQKVLIVDFNTLLSKFISRYIFTIFGTFFYTHDEKLGLLPDISREFKTERKKFKKLRDSYEPDSDMYKFNDGIQYSMKVLLNAISYGVLALNSFRYNDKNIGNTITMSGRLQIKIAQYFADRIIQNMF